MGTSRHARGLQRPVHQRPRCVSGRPAWQRAQARLFRRWPAAWRRHTGRRCAICLRPAIDRIGGEHLCRTCAPEVAETNQGLYPPFGQRERHRRAERLRARRPGTVKEASDLQWKLRFWPEQADTFYLFRWMYIEGRAAARFDRRYGRPLSQEGYPYWDLTRNIHTRTKASRTAIAEELISARAARGALDLPPLRNDAELLIWWLVWIGDQRGIILKGRYPRPIPDCHLAPWAEKGGNAAAAKRMFGERIGGRGR